VVVEFLGVVGRGVFDPRSLCATSWKSGPGSRWPRAIRSASSPRPVGELPAETLREKGVDHEGENSAPSYERRYVKSPTHRRVGSFALKSRLTRPAVGLGSGLVVRQAWHG
jgi:hypothetical protein